MKHGALFLLLATICSSAAGVVHDESKFQFNLTDWLSPTSLKIRWSLDQKLTWQSLGFNFILEGHQSNRSFHFPKMLRSAVFENVTDQFTGLRGVALFSGHAPFGFEQALWRSCIALYSSADLLFCCVDLLCHENSTVFTANSQILAMCYGASVQEVLVATESELIVFDLQVHKSSRRPFALGRDIRTMDYDWLNGLLMVQTATKIYQIRIRDMLLVQIEIPRGGSFLDAAVDPVHGFIHALTLVGSQYSLVSLPSLISSNTTLPTVTVRTTAVPLSYSILVERFRSLLTILGDNHISQYFLANSSISSRTVQFRILSKLQRDEPGYLSWALNTFYHFNENGQTHGYDVHVISSAITHYTNQLSISRDFPSPDLPLQLTNSFFGAEYLLVSWRQPFPAWHSATSWRKYNFTATIQSGDSARVEKSFGQQEQLLRIALIRNKSYTVTVTTGMHSASLIGQSLSKNVPDMLQYFLIRNGSVEAFKMNLTSFEKSQVESPFRDIGMIKDIKMFNTCAFILFENGTIIRRTRSSTEMLNLAGKVSKMEVDYRTGNVFFTALGHQGVSRLRPAPNATYKMDELVKFLCIDFTIFPNLNVLVAADGDGDLHFLDLNGAPVGTAMVATIRTDFARCGGEFVRVVQLNGERRILSAPGSVTRCLATDLGTVSFLRSGILLSGWNGNASLDLLSHPADASLRMAFAEQHECDQVRVASIPAESISLSRADPGGILLSWDASTEPGVQYQVVLENYEGNITAGLTSSPPMLVTVLQYVRRHMVNVTAYGVCRDVLRVSVKACFPSTAGDPAVRMLSMPCTGAAPVVLELFAIRKTHGPRKPVLELKARFLIGAITATIDNRFQCRFRTFFSRRSGSSWHNQTLGNWLISCRDDFFVASMDIEPMGQFLWRQLCGELLVALMPVTQCISSNPLQSDDTVIFLPTNQSYLTTYLGEIVTRISVSQNRTSILVWDVNQRVRTVLHVRDSRIEKIEVDWMRNALFWSLSDNDGVRILSTRLDVNRANLLEAGVLWFADNGTGLLWTTGSVDRQLYVSLGRKALVASLDYGPFWYRNSWAIIACRRLRGAADAMSCAVGDLSIGNATLRGYFVPSRRTVVYESEEEHVCHSHRVKDNYALPERVSRCEFRVVRDDMVLVRTEMRLSGNASGDIVIDRAGEVRAVGSRAVASKTVSMGQVAVVVRLQCARHSASVEVESRRSEPALRVGITYQGRDDPREAHVRLLSRQLADRRRHRVSVRNLLPGTRYVFRVALEDSRSRRTNQTDVVCVTLSDFPEPPRALALRALNATHDELVWEQGAINGNGIVEYRVAVRSPGASAELLLSSRDPRIVLVKENGFRLVTVSARNDIGTSAARLFNVSRAPERGSPSVPSGPSLTVGHSSYLFVIVTVLICAAVVLTSITVHLCRSKRYKALKPIHSFRINEDILEMRLASQNIKYDVNSLYNLERFPLSNFDKVPHVLNECLTYSHLIGNGAFGMVFKGTMKIETDGCSVKYQPVALKIRNGKSISEDDFKREAVLMFKYTHPHIVELYGVSFDCPDKQCLILEYMERGNLRQYLQHHRTDVIKRQILNNPRRKIINENSLLDTRDLINIATDILEALKFLEKKNFVHRDIAARNCLVSHQNRKPRVTKLGDFGLARDIYSDEYYKKVSETKMPVRWMAPETIKDGLFTGKSDVWAFGVLCWEIMSFGMDPYMGQANSEVIKDVLAGKHLERPDNCPNEFYDIMVQCWKYYPESRPTFSEIDILFQYLDEIKDFDEGSTLSRLIIRSYDSSQDSEFGKTTDPTTEKTSISTTDKYADIQSHQTSEHNVILVQSNYDNLGYEVPTSPSPTLATKQPTFALLVDTTNDAT